MKQMTSKPRSGFLSALRPQRSFARDERGVTMIEFGLLALPFFAIVAAIMETSVTFLASNIFESALHDSTRLIRTGQAQKADYSLPTFRAKICERTYGMFDCNKIMVRVRTVPSFAEATVSDPIDPNTNDWVIVEQYQPGVSKSIVIAEVYYKWDTMFDIMGFNLQSLSDGTMLMGSAEVWRNEPFGA